MALQDLTPQLRTRLSRMERAVGWFVVLAVALLVFGFAYYVYNTAERKGWFLTKAPYFTFVAGATGLKVGDPVTLMGFDAGTITDIKPMPAEQFVYNVYVEFVLKSPNYGYIWTEGSKAKVATADLLGKRVLEVSKGTGGYPSYVFHPIRTISVSEAATLPEANHWVLGEEIIAPDGTNLVAKPFDGLTNLAAVAAAGSSQIVVLDTREKRKGMTGIWHDKQGRYDPYTNGVSKYWLVSDESPALTERLEAVVSQVQQAVPNILALTNQLSEVLSNTAQLTSNLNIIAVSAGPAISNISAATADLNRPGALGEWLLPTNISHQLEGALSTAHDTLTTANTNLAALAENLNRSLENLAGITSNLNSQVAANTNLVKAVSDAIVHADEFIQGLKRHWLFRSAFKKSEPKEPKAPPPKPLRSPKAKAGG